MIVGDSNVLAYVYLTSECAAAAKPLFERDSEWATPALWRIECRNILAGYMRRKVLTFEQALSLQQEAEGWLAGSEFEVAPSLCSSAA